MDIFYLKIMGDVKGVLILVHFVSQSVQYYFPMVISSLWTTPFKFLVFMECSIELSEIHPIIDETDIQITSFYWYLEGPSAVGSPGILNWCSFCREWLGNLKVPVWKEHNAF